MNKFLINKNFLYRHNISQSYSTQYQYNTFKKNPIHKNYRSLKIPFKNSTRALTETNLLTPLIIDILDKSGLIFSTAQIKPVCTKLEKIAKIISNVPESYKC